MKTNSVAEVVEWQTRTFEGRVAQAVRVQVPPSAPKLNNGRYIKGMEPRICGLANKLQT